LEFLYQEQNEGRENQSLLKTRVASSDLTRRFCANGKYRLTLNLRREGRRIEFAKAAASSLPAPEILLCRPR
jgi:hypothetical protein